MQCLLSEQRAYAGKLTGTLNPATLAAMSAWQTAHGLHVRTYWSRRAWMTLLATGTHPVLKYGSTGPAVRDLQRTLNAATPGTDLPVNGIFGPRTDIAMRGLADRRPTGRRRGHQRRHLGRAGQRPEGFLDHGAQRAASVASPAKKPRPSVPAPVRPSTACSGWGIRPTTLPASLVMPAMSCREPLGLSSR